MELRFFKKSEKKVLIDAIDRLWKHNHIYVRNPEVLDHLVLNTPYRIAFSGEDNYSFLGIWDEGQIVGLRGIIPQKMNFYGADYSSATSTIWITDRTWGKRVDGLSLRRYVTDYKLGMDLSLGLSEMSLMLYRPFGYDVIEAFPRWVGIVNVPVTKEVLIRREVPIEILPVVHRKRIGNCLDIEVDKLDGEKWDLYYENSFAPYSIGTKRDYEFLRWRYMESPVLKYHSIVVKDSSGKYRGLAIFRIESILNNRYKIGRILEFMALESETSIKLADAIVGYDTSVLMWDFYSLSNITVYGLEMLGFIQIPAWEDRALTIPTRFQPLDYKMVQINGAIYLDKNLRKKISHLNNCPWYITRGDGDQDRAN